MLEDMRALVPMLGVVEVGILITSHSETVRGTYHAFTIFTTLIVWLPLRSERFCSYSDSS